MYIGHKSWHFLSILLFLQATRKKLKGFRYSYLVSVAKGTTKAAPQFPHTRSSINSRRFNIRWLSMYFYNVASATYPSDDYIFHFLLGLVAVKKKKSKKWTRNSDRLTLHWVPGMTVLGKWKRLEWYGHITHQVPICVLQTYEFYSTTDPIRLVR